MNRRKLLRKYQAGGVIPSFQNGAAFSQPFQVQRVPNPIIFDSSSTTQAVGARDRSKQVAISEANLNNAERRLNWAKDVDERDFLYKRLDAVQSQLQLGMDSLTNLDMNIPDQMKLSTEIRGQLETLQKESATLLLDSSLNPQERAARLNENVSKAKSIMSNPEYVKHIQNNTIAKKFYDHIAEASSDDKSLLDFDAVNFNMDLVKQLQDGKIGRDTFFKKVKKFAIDINTADTIEKDIYKLMTDAITKAPKNWEEYSGNDDAIIFLEKMQIGSLQDQATALKEYLMSQEIWKKKQEASGRFTNAEGLIDEAKVQDFAERTVRFYRTQYGLPDEAVNKNTDIKVTNRSAAAIKAENGTVGGTSGATTGNSVEERRVAGIAEGLQNRGYTVLDPYIIDKDDSPTEIINLINTPDEQLVNEFGKVDQKLVKKKQIYKDAIKKTSELTPAEQEKARSPMFQSPSTVSTTKTPNLGDETLNTVNASVGGTSGQSKKTTAEITGLDDNGNIVQLDESVTSKYAEATSGPPPVIDDIVIPTDFFNMIDQTESRGDYSALYNFENREGGAFADVDITDMTISELKEFTKPDGPYGRKTLETLRKQNPNRDVTATPLGRYQIVGTKLKEVQKEMNIPDSAKFTPELQDKMAAYIFQKRLKSADTLSGKRRALRNEWEGFDNIPDQLLNAMIQKYELGLDRSKTTPPPVVPNEIQKIEMQIRELVNNNIYNDDIADQISKLEGQIDLIKKEENKAKLIAKKIESIKDGDRMEIDLGTSVYDPRAVTPLSKSKLEVQKSTIGNLYRVYNNNKIIAENLNNNQLYDYLSSISGKPLTQLKKIDGTKIKDDKGVVKPVANNTIDKKPARVGMFNN